MDRDVVAHEQAVAAFLMITVGAAGIMINGYVLYGVLVHKAFGKVFGAICASQILANLGNSFVFAVLVGPISIIDFDFHKTYWGTRCGQLLVIFWNASLLSHLLTSVNRCANVLLPCKQTENVFSPKLTHYLIAFTWIFALCQGIPYFLPACTLEFSAAQFKFNFHETDCKPYLYYYADYYYSIIVVSLIAMVDICTVLQIRSLQKKKILHKKSKDVKFFFQALIQAIITMTELVVYFWLSSLFANNKWAYFYATTLIWIVEECCDGVVFIVFNKDIRHRSSVVPTSNGVVVIIGSQKLDL
ncbi:hypothetical protein QR680_007162 [Steinernema hermaphroditum]|uniref:G-protein coupled receptors family 1 profile domain-containing protein n=1 Tax=Steinernema hermaphroditum TaxID=289476 RepID=A0AA39HZ33_9BILA|nr:hypothetical protein QR680_007162 [Steinernema hermaphroditum]